MRKRPTEQWRRGTGLRPVWTAALWLVAAGCSVESTTLEPLPLATDCRCEGEVCPVDVCGVRLTVEAESCEGKVGAVEIMLGETLEPHVWRPGDTVTACASIGRGQAVTMHARADKGWKWTEEVFCPDPEAGQTVGPAITRILHCVGGE